MPFVREVEHLRRNLQPLQRGKELESFTDIKSVIELPMHYQGWRLEFVGKQMRRKFPVTLSVLPGRAFELPFREPNFLRRSVGRFGIEHAVVRHDAFESIGVA